MASIERCVFCESPMVGLYCGSWKSEMQNNQPTVPSYFLQKGSIWSWWVQKRRTQDDDHRQRNESLSCQPCDSEGEPIDGTELKEVSDPLLCIELHLYLMIIHRTVVRNFHTCYESKILFSFFQLALSRTEEWICSASWQQYWCSITRSFQIIFTLWSTHPFCGCVGVQISPRTIYFNTPASHI